MNRLQQREEEGLDKLYFHSKTRSGGREMTPRKELEEDMPQCECWEQFLHYRPSKCFVCDLQAMAPTNGAMAWLCLWCKVPLCMHHCPQPPCLCFFRCCWQLWTGGGYVDEHGLVN